jgi:hypothetical protein
MTDLFSLIPQLWNSPNNRQSSNNIMAPPDQAVSLLDCGTRDGESDNVVLRDPRDVM